MIETDSAAGETLRREIDLAPGGTQVVLLPVPVRASEPPPGPATAAPPSGPPGRLSITALPESAEVSLDGAPLPTDRRGDEITLASGVHQVSVALEGYVTQEREVTVRADALEEIRIDLLPVRGRISVESTPAGAEVTLDGRVRGRTPVTIEGLDFDRYRVGVSLDGYRSTRRRVLLTRAEPNAELQFELEEQ